MTEKVKLILNRYSMSKFNKPIGLCTITELQAIEADLKFAKQLTEKTPVTYQPLRVVYKS